MDWQSKRSDLVCKLPGGVPDSADATARFFSESLLLCKREMRDLSKSLQEFTIEILQQEAHHILNDFCAQVARESAKECPSSRNSLQQVFPGLHVPAEPPPMLFHDSSERNQLPEFPIDNGLPFVTASGFTVAAEDPLEGSRVREHGSKSSSCEEIKHPRHRPSIVTVDKKDCTKDTEWTQPLHGMGEKRFSAEMLSKIHTRLSFLSVSKNAEFKNNRIGKLVTSDAFDYGFGLILVLNAIAMGFSANWEALNLGKTQPIMFAIIDLLFCFAFLLELGFRLYVFRFAFYFMSGWQWAYFDTVIVSMQAFEELMKLIRITQSNGGSDSEKGGGIFDVLKLLKVFRLLRMVRMVRLFPELKSMVYLIFASMNSFLWSCVLLCIMIYSIAVYLTMMATDVLVEKGINATPELIHVHLYWGSLGDSIMSLYWSITGGQDWGDLIQPLVIETGQQFHNVIFAMYIAFATMVVMNLVTGVFVEGAQRLTKEDKDREVIKMAYKTFNAVDDDANVEISNTELNHHMQSGNMDAYLEAINLQRQECLDLFQLLDNDGSGTISLQEFTQGCLKLRGQARAADVAQLILDVRDVKEDMSRNLLSLNESCKSVVDMITMGCQLAPEPGCEV